MKSTHSSARRFHCDDYGDDDVRDGPQDNVGRIVPGPALTLSETAPIRAAGALLVEHRVPAIAIVGGDGTLRGLVTRTDVLTAADLTRPVGELMSTFVFSVPWYASIHRAASLIAYECVGQVVVTGQGNVLRGIVSAVDIARYFAATRPSRSAPRSSS